MIVCICPQCGQWQNVALTASFERAISTVIKALGGEPVPVSPQCPTCKTELIVANPHDRLLFLSRTMKVELLPEGFVEKARKMLQEMETDALERYRVAQHMHIRYEQKDGSLVERGEDALSWLPRLRDSDYQPSEKDIAAAIKLIGQLLYLLYHYAGTPNTAYTLESGQKDGYID